MPIVIGVPTLIDFMKNSHAYDYWGAYTYSGGYSSLLCVEESQGHFFYHIFQKV